MTAATCPPRVCRPAAQMWCEALLSRRVIFAVTFAPIFSFFFISLGQRVVT